jgi:hypothetical protein
MYRHCNHQLSSTYETTLYYGSGRLEIYENISSQKENSDFRCCTQVFEIIYQKYCTVHYTATLEIIFKDRFSNTDLVS